MRFDSIEMNGIFANKTPFSIASGNIVDLATANSNLIDVTGATGPIGDFGTVAAGIVFNLTFDSNPQITNSASIILPTGATIDAAAGDTMQIQSLGSGNWKCTGYLRADGNSLVPSPYTKDANDNVFYFGGTATLGTGCSNNNFEQGTIGNSLGNDCRDNSFGQSAINNTLGNDCLINTFMQATDGNTLGTTCASNIFQQAASLNTLGANCYNNIFEQESNNFIFGANLLATTIRQGITGANYTASPDYDFLYSKTYPSEIFYNGTDNVHSYIDAANNRIVLTNLTTLEVSYLSSEIDILYADIVTLAGVPNLNLQTTYNILPGTSLIQVTAATTSTLNPNAINLSTGKTGRYTLATDWFIPIDNIYAVAPMATEDSTKGYAVGDYWVDSVTNIQYQCTDATATAAVWQAQSGDDVTFPSWTPSITPDGVNCTAAALNGAYIFFRSGNIVTVNCPFDLTIDFSAATTGTFTIDPATLPIPSTAPLIIGIGQCDDVSTWPINCFVESGGSTFTIKSGNGAASASYLVYFTFSYSIN